MDAVPTVDALLEWCRLSQYTEAFIKNGWDDVEYLQRMAKADPEQLRKIAELQAQLAELKGELPQRGDDQSDAARADE